jgi:chaperone required for assembly of F1-ATPase
MRNELNSGWTIGDPLGSVQRDARPALPKRFYREAAVEARDGGFALRLDGRAARTPGKRPLTFPTRTLAEQIAAEWNAQGEFLDPREMPLTRLANSAIDGVAQTMAQTRADLAAYAASDLLCYRAAAPERLAALQAEAHDPVLQWAHDAFGAEFVVTASVTHVRQPEAALAAIGARLEACVDPFEFAALHVLTTLTGSALLALAVAHGRLAADEAWRAAHVDEDFQIAQWGEDDEATIRRAARWREMQAAALMLAAATTRRAG